MSDLPQDPPESPDRVDIELTDRERELVRAVAFSIEVEKFIHGPVGDYLFALAGEEEARCDVALRFAVPTDVKTICDLQVRARAVGYLKTWLEAAVQAGIDAQREAEQPPE